MAQRHRLVEVPADFEQTIVNKAIDQWRKQVFVKAKGWAEWLVFDKFELT